MKTAKLLTTILLWHFLIVTPVKNAPTNDPKYGRNPTPLEYGPFACKAQADGVFASIIGADPRRLNAPYIAIWDDGVAPTNLPPECITSP